MSHRGFCAAARHQCPLLWLATAGYTLLPIWPWASPQPSLPGCSLGDTPARFGGTRFSGACWLPLGLAQVLPSCVSANGSDSSLLFCRAGG